MVRGHGHSLLYQRTGSSLPEVCNSASRDSAPFLTTYTGVDTHKQAYTFKLLKISIFKPFKDHKKIK